MKTPLNASANRSNAANVTVILTALVAVGLGALLCSCQPKTDDHLRIGNIVVSRTGVLNPGSGREYVLVPADQYPANLSGISIIDIEENIFVARFTHPAGVGVAGYFDVCFQCKGPEVYAKYIEFAGSLERLNSGTHMHSLSYLYDSDKHLVIRCDPQPLTKSVTLDTLLKPQISQ